MKELEDRYLNGSLTSQELDDFLVQLNSESDDAVAKRMESRWKNDKIDTSHVDFSELHSIWNRISDQIQPSYKEAILYHSWKWLQLVAVMLLPILLIFSVYFYHQNRVLSSEVVTMSTGKGERATITLPDGTKVALNEISTLKYNSRTFNRAQRQINFDGEGYFEVAKDPEHPFQINADKLNVKVLGTKFNLCARDQDGTAILALSEGKVLFTSLPTGENVVLFPHQKAVLNKLTGSISVEQIQQGLKDMTAWRRKEIVFRNAPLSFVIAKLEETYGVKIIIKGNVSLNDLYTGTMSSADINVDLEILERLYHLKSEMYGNRVYIEK